MALIRSGRETKAEKLGPWRSVERVVRDGRLLYAVGALIPREEAVRQGLIKEEAAEEATPRKSQARKSQARKKSQKKSGDGA